MNVTVKDVLESAKLSKIEYLPSATDHLTEILVSNENDKLKYNFARQIPEVANTINSLSAKGEHIAPAHPKMTALLTHIWTRNALKEDHEVLRAATALIQAHIEGAKDFNHASKAFNKLATEFGFEQAKTYNLTDSRRAREDILASGSRAGQALKPQNSQAKSTTSRL